MYLRSEPALAIPRVSDGRIRWDRVSLNSSELDA